MKYWLFELFDMDPCNGNCRNPYVTGHYNPLYRKQTVFFGCSTSKELWSCYTFTRVNIQDAPPVWHLRLEQYPRYLAQSQGRQKMDTIYVGPTWMSQEVSKR